jgi:hypothetical protein
MARVELTCATRWRQKHFVRISKAEGVRWVKLLSLESGEYKYPRNIFYQNSLTKKPKGKMGFKKKFLQKI